MFVNKKEEVFIIAELSANHNNDFDLAVKTIQAMAFSGADAVKIQTYKPESLTLNVNNSFFAKRTDGLWKGKTPYEIFAEGSMPYDWQPKLKIIAEKLGLIFFSSPFDFEGVDFLEKIEVPIYKIASPEINDIPLVEYIARKGKPIIISTGLADLEDIQLALDTCFKVGNNNISLLKCTTQYPAAIEAANLLTIPDMKQRFNVEIGISDHTMGALVPIVAVALGAKIIEKHFILDRNLGGIDSKFSMEPAEFKQMVNDIRNTEKSFGKISYDVPEKDKLRRRSLFTIKDIKIGEANTEKNIRSIRPGYGLSPRYYYEIIGKTAKVDLERGKPLKWDDII
ncbi:MAG: pseudaminic acid synthase [Bacteroidetes bacterium]|nr:pseudaminic acid synthase [Bacteroidota bacterium]